MKTIICPFHNRKIVIYDKNEERLFVDNNGLETIIFTDDSGKMYLKRFVVGSCDEDCETVKQILEGNIDTGLVEEGQPLIVKYNTHWAEVKGFQSGDRPLKVERTIGEKNYKFNCYVTESLRKLYNKSELLIGDKVLITFVEGNINKPLALDKIMINVEE